LLSLYPAAGVYFGYGLGGTTKSLDLDEVGNLVSGKSDFFGKEGAKRFDSGISLGVNLQVTKFIAGLGYDYGLTKLYDNGNTRNSNVKVSLAYLF
jgi:hypothetical protein